LFEVVLLESLFLPSTRRVGWLKARGPQHRDGASGRVLEVDGDARVARDDGCESVERWERRVAARVAHAVQP